MSFDLTAKIGADGTGYFREIDKVDRATAQLAAKLKGQMGQIGSGIKEFGGGLASGFGAPLAAGAAAYALVDLTRRTIAYGGEINDLSARLGVSTDALQELDYAMTQNGATLGDATAAMQKLGIARVEALEKGGDKMDAFKALGISVEQLKTARLEDLFKAVGRSVRDTADVQLVLGDAITVMGKGAGSVLAAMRGDLDAAAESARKLGLIIDADTIKKLDELGDKSATMGKLIMAGLAEPLLFAMELIYKIVDGFEVAFSMAARWGEMLGKISAGVSFKVAIEEKNAGIEKDLQNIADAADARVAGREIAARGPAALGFAGEGEAVQKADSLLKIKEKIAKLEFEGLDKAARRAELERKLAEASQAHADVLRQIAAADPQSQQRGKVQELEAKAGDLAGSMAGTGQQIAKQRRTVGTLEIAAINNPLNSKAQQRMEAAQLKLAEMLADEAAVAARLSDLNERIIALKAELLAHPENPELNRKLDEAKLAKLEAKKAIDGLKEDKGGKGFESRQNSDSLAKIGLFVGGSPVGVKVEPLSGPLHRQEFRNLVQALDRGVAVQVAAIERGTLATKEVLA